LNLPFFIAKRYILGKKSHNAINIVSYISVAGVIIGTAAFILLLSVFNGFDQLARGMYNSFYPDIKVEPLKGKVFQLTDNTLIHIQNIEGVENIAQIMEDNALIIYKEKQTVCKVKGVSSTYNLVTNIDSLIWQGEYRLKYLSMPRVVLGRGLYYALGISMIEGIEEVLKFYVPKRTVHMSNDPNRSLNRKLAQVSGVFSSQPDIDEKYVLVPLDFAQGLFEYPNSYSSLEIKINQGANEKQVISALQKILGNNVVIKNRYRQNELLYKTMRTEKYAIFMILVLVLIILLFSLVGTISMLIIEKKKDISILNSIGASKRLIRKIFYREGLLITFTGVIIGLLLGSAVALLQEKFGLVKLEGGFIIDAYPVDMQSFDLLLVSTTVLIIGGIASWYPVRFLLKNSIENKY